MGEADLRRSDVRERTETFLDTLFIIVLPATCLAAFKKTLSHDLFCRVQKQDELRFTKLGDEKVIQRSVETGDSVAHAW